MRKCAVFILCCSPLNLITVASSCSWWLTCGPGGDGTARCIGEQNMRFPDGSGTDVTAEITNSQHAHRKPQFIRILKPFVLQCQIDLLVNGSWKEYPGYKNLQGLFWIFYGSATSCNSKVLEQCCNFQSVLKVNNKTTLCSKINRSKNSRYT